MDYGIYIGKIVGTTSDTDDRLQVRILPHMEDTVGIPDSMCPRWSYFFKEEMLSGSKGDLVWVICDSEFSNGYILGLANYYTYKESSFKRGKIKSMDKEETNFSIPQDLIDSIKETYLSLKGEILSLKNIKVSYWSDTAIHFVERSTGGKIIAYNNGSITVIRPSEFFVHIGNSTLKITSDNISISSPQVLVQGEDIGIGNNPVGKALYTVGSDATIASISESVRI